MTIVASTNREKICNIKAFQIKLKYCVRLNSTGKNLNEGHCPILFKVNERVSETAKRYKKKLNSVMI